MEIHLRFTKSKSEVDPPSKKKPPLLSRPNLRRISLASESSANQQLGYSRYGWDEKGGRADSLNGFAVCYFFLFCFSSGFGSLCGSAPIIHVVCRGFYSFLIPSSGWTKRAGGCALKGGLIFIHTRQKHNTILASISEPRSDNLFSSGKWKSQEAHDL